MKNKQLFAAMAILMLGTVSACDGEPEPDDREPLAQELDDSEAEAEPITQDVIATTDLPNGTHLEFIEFSNGGVAVSEDSPIGVPSAIGYMKERFDATPAEMFTMVVGDSEPMPAALRHLQDDLVMRGEADPTRALEMPPALTAPIDAQSDDWKNDYAFNCTFANDGPEFDVIWQAWGFGWHWYNYVTDQSRVSPAYTGTQFIAHVCNNGPAHGHYNTLHYVSHAGSGLGGFWYNYVGVDRRSVVYMWNMPSADYNTKFVNYATSITAGIGFAGPS